MARSTTSNGRTRTVRYKPRYTQMQAYDLLPPTIRAALREGAQEWDCNSILREYRRLAKFNSPVAAANMLAAAIQKQHAIEIEQAKDWKFCAKLIGAPSPHIGAQATMQLSGE